MKSQKVSGCIHIHYKFQFAPCAFEMLMGVCVCPQVREGPRDPGGEQGGPGK